MNDNIDPDLFNTDPKYEKQRGVFDKMFEGAVNRAIEKKKKENPETDDDNVFDTLFGGMFGGKK
jgi:hypothetical protein